MVMEQIFNEEQQEKAQFISNHPLAKLSDLRSNEIKDLATVLCCYSGKIDGNGCAFRLLTNLYFFSIATLLLP